LRYHEELESLVKNIRGLRRIRFWMTFSDQYITHPRVLENVGMTRIDPIEFEGQQIVPLKFLKALLPDPSSLGQRYEGKTVIGCSIDGEKDGKRKREIIHNVCDHAAADEEVRAQPISYTTGGPALIGGMMMLGGTWR